MDTCRKAKAAVNVGGIAVAANDPLTTVGSSGKSDTQVSLAHETSYSAVDPVRPAPVDPSIDARANPPGPSNSRGRRVFGGGLRPLERSLLEERAHGDAGEAEE